MVRLNGKYLSIDKFQNLKKEIAEIKSTTPTKAYENLSKTRQTSNVSQNSNQTNKLDSEKKKMISDFYGTVSSTGHLSTKLRKLSVPLASYESISWYSENVTRGCPVHSTCDQYWPMDEFGLVCFIEFFDL